MKNVVLYLARTVMRVIYFFIKLFTRQKEKVTFLSRQSDTMSIDFKLLKEMFNKETTLKIEVLCKKIPDNLGGQIGYCFYIVKCMYHIATSKACIIDGYNIPVSSLKHKKGLEIVQIWHAMGAIKKFGYQILDMEDFVALCNRINELLSRLEAQHILVDSINVGGGLGVDYAHPNRKPVPDFKEYFSTYASQLKIRSYQTVHFELGRSVVAQCGTLISRVLYVKQGTNKLFAILDAGMTDLIRPALYQAYHKIENITSDGALETYDVVGPVCESSDVFGKAIDLNQVRRGDLVAIRSAGAYGEVMASQYNCRELPKSYLSDELV